MTTAQIERPVLSHAEILPVILGLLLVLLLAALDQTIMATALPTIGHDLGNASELSWVITSYLLVTTVTAPLYGKLSDIHGRRLILMVAISLFVVGSALCALAPTMLTLILARGLQGLGGGGLMSLVQTIIGDLVPPRERGRYQAYIAMTWAGASLAGPVLGGFIAEHLHWSVIFWINIPLGIAAFLMTSERLKRLPRHERPHKLDIPGAVLVILATTALLLALNWGGSTFAWTSPMILALIVGALVFAVLFVIRLMTVSEPLIPLSVLRNPIILAAVATACFGMSSFIGLSVYVPIHFQALEGLTASQAGLGMIPIMVFSTLGSVISTRYARHHDHYKTVPLMGLAVAAIGSLLLAWTPLGAGMLVIDGLLSVVSLGAGTVFAVSMVAMQNAVPFHQLGTTTGLMNFMRSLGAALTVAVFGVFVVAGHEGGTSGLQATSLQEVHAGFQIVFLLTALLLIAAFCAFAWMEEKPLGGASAPVDMSH